MSTAANLKARINELTERRLFHLPPAMPSAPMLRELFVAEDVRDDVNPPWPELRTAERHIEFRETLDHFTQGDLLSVSESPFKKSRYAVMSRTHPVGREVWDIRCTQADQGIRCFGCFAGKDLFVALTWNYRENITDFTDFNREVEGCRYVWGALFDPLQPFTGRTLDDYLTNYYLVGKARRR